MSLCIHFQNPAEAQQCRCGVRYQALAGGSAHYMLLRLPCYELSNRRGEDISQCDKYQSGECHEQKK